MRSRVRVIGGDGGDCDLVARLSGVSRPVASFAGLI